MGGNPLVSGATSQAINRG